MGVDEEEDGLREKNVFFQALPELPLPISGNLYLFFGRQKRRFARMTVAMIIMIVNFMIIMTKIPKKHTIIKSFGVKIYQF